MPRLCIMKATSIFPAVRREEPINFVVKNLAGQLLPIELLASQRVWDLKVALVASSSSTYRQVLTMMHDSPDGAFTILQDDSPLKLYDITNQTELCLFVEDAIPMGEVQHVHVQIDNCNSQTSFER